MLTLTTNTRIRAVKRPGPRDRYGQASAATVYEQIRGFLEKRARFRRSAAGDVSDVDAELVLARRFALKVNDFVTVENSDADEYQVVDVDESLDHMGVVVFRTYGLAKQKKDA